MTANTITPQVEDVLRRSRIEGTTLYLPPGQLDRKLYVAVNEVLERLGGDWSRKAKGHTFKGSPQEALAAVLDTGEMPAKNPLDFFPTPPEVVSLLLDYAGLDNGQRVLEPSAGIGAIARAIAAEGLDIELECIELDPQHVATLRASGFTTIACDFLQYSPFAQSMSAPGYDRIVMNPPFRAEGDPLAYITHIDHAYGMLAIDGRLVSVAPSGFTFREDRRCAEFRAMVRAKGGWSALPEGAFTTSGTGVNTVLLWMDA